MSELTQLTQADLKAMSPEAIVKAGHDGRLSNLTNPGKPRQPADPRGLELADLEHLSPETLEQLRADGTIDAVIRNATAPAVEPEPPVVGSADMGARGGIIEGQLGREQLRGMSSAEIVRAQREGQLDELLGVPRHS